MPAHASAAIHQPVRRIRPSPDVRNPEHYVIGNSKTIPYGDRTPGGLGVSPKNGSAAGTPSPGTGAGGGPVLCSRVELFDDQRPSHLRVDLAGERVLAGRQLVDALDVVH